MVLRIDVHFWLESSSANTTYTAAGKLALVRRTSCLLMVLSVLIGSVCPGHL